MADAGGPVVADQRLYLTRDKTRLVPDGDPDAWTLFCTPGSTIPRDQAARYGLLAGQESAEPDESPKPDGGTAEAEAVPKRRTPRTNKARQASGDK